MAYKSDKPVTTSNCPTRDALEKPAQGESIHARHTDKQRQQHAANLVARASNSQNKSRSIQRQVKTK